MNYYLPEQCLALDKISQTQFGMTADVLMENAGRSVASAIMDHFKDDLKSQPVTVVCGPGNNGGDGLVIARLFANQAIQVHVIHVLPKGQDPKSEASRVHLALLKKHQVPYRTVAIGDDQGFKEALGQNPGICIDALFGVGAREPYEPFWLTVFQVINQSVVFSVSVDHPSGYATRDGAEVGHPFIKARLTCSIGLPKFAQYTHAGTEASGEIVMCDAGFPQAAVEQMKPYATGIQFDYVLNHFKRPTEHAHKNQMGHVGFYAGSQQMPGALNMCVLSAQQSGVGKLTVFGHQADIETFQRVLPPEVMYGTPKNAEQFCDMVQQKRIQTLVVGPGLALPSEQVKSILWAASKLNVRLILDAEVFRHLTAKEVKQNFPANSNVVWIGHLGEQQLFFERPSVSDMFDQSLSLYKDWLETFPNHVWLRKGHGSVLMSQKGLMLNESGNVGLAKGGSGDVLAGILGAFLARDVALDVSTATAVWVHGRAADLVLAKTGNPLSVTPSACIQEIAQVLKEIYDEPPKPSS